MFPLNGLHAIAAARGDGLRPEILALLEARQRDAKVADLSRHRGVAEVQAGPNPVGSLDGELPEGVIRFPAPTRPAIAGSLPVKRQI